MSKKSKALHAAFQRWWKDEAMPGLWLIGGKERAIRKLCGSHG